MSDRDDPEWEPLERVVGRQGRLEDFMWMYEVQMPDGGQIHVYKHIDSRQYLHLDLSGNAYAYVDKERYRQVPLVAVLSIVLPAFCHMADWRVPGGVER
jgi:hypothetical protein